LEVGGVGAVNRELIAHSSTTLHLAPTLRRLLQVPRDEEGVRVGGLYKKDLSYFLRRRDSRGLELEIKAVVGLEEETFERGGMGGVGLVGPIAGFELEGSMIGVDGDGGLWNPGERFCKARAKAVKEYTSESKRISNCSVSRKVSLYSLVPAPYSRMERKPASMESVRLFNRPASLDSCCTRTTPIVNSVYGVLAFLTSLSSGIAVLLEFGEIGAEHIFGIFRMDVNAATKGGFEVFVLGLPRNDLGIGALQIRLEHHESGVGEEEFANVRKCNAEGHFKILCCRSQRRPAPWALVRRPPVS